MFLRKFIRAIICVFKFKFCFDDDAIFSVEHTNPTASPKIMGSISCKFRKLSHPMPKILTFFLVKKLCFRKWQILKDSCGLTIQIFQLIVAPRVQEMDANYKKLTLGAKEEDVTPNLWKSSVFQLGVHGPLGIPGLPPGGVWFS